MLIKNILIKRIYQKTNCVFTIEWIDDTIRDYRLSSIQKHCPCARCVDENTGKRLVDPQSIAEELTAKRVYSVGRYAIKIEFSSGCSRGIYPLSWLKHFAS